MLDSIVHTHNGHAISLVVTVGNIVVDVTVELLQETINQCYCRTSVHIIVAIDHDTLLTSHRLVEPFHCHIHILHQERVMQVLKLWTKIRTCRFGGLYAALHQHLADYGADVDSVSQSLRRFQFLGCRWLVIPFVIHLYMSFYYNLF